MQNETPEVHTTSNNNVAHNTIVDNNLVDSNTANNDTAQKNKTNQADNKISYAERLKVNKEIIAFLAKEFPNCFSLEGEAKPLKVGIFQDMVEQEIISQKYSKTLLRAALRYYTMTWRYLSSIKEGSVRVDLHGAESGILDASHVEHAQTQLQEAKKKVQARKAEKAKQASNNKTKTADATNKLSRDKKAKEVHKPIQKQAKKIANPPKSSKISTLSDRQDNTSDKKDNDKAVLVTGNISNLDITTLYVGQKVQIMLAKTRTEAEITEIMKDNVRVNLSSGLSLSVGLEHIYL